MASNTKDLPKGGNKGPEIIAVLWACTSFASILVITRLWIRKRVLNNLGVDDWLIAVSMVLGLIFCATATKSVSEGYGQHTWNLTVPQAEKALLWNMISFIFGILSFALPKLAIAALLTRIMNPSKIQRFIIWGLVSLVAAVAIVNILIYVTMCNPPQALWKFSMILSGEAKCKSVWLLIHYATFNGVLSALVDLYLAIYPSFVLFRLQMSLRKRLALSAALGLGAVAAATAIVKCAQLKGLANKSDPTYGAVPLVIWTNIEADVVIMASCIPTLQPVLELLWGKRKWTTNNSHQKYYQQNSSYANDLSSRSHHRSHITTKDDLHDTSDVESQEIILPQDGKHLHPTSPTSYQIRRTDEVCVEFELQTQTSPTHKLSF